MRVDGDGAVNCELGPGSLNLGGQFTERAFSVHRIGFTEYAVVQLLLTHAEVVVPDGTVGGYCCLQRFDPALDRIWRLYSFTCDLHLSHTVLSRCFQMG